MPLPLLVPPPSAERPKARETVFAALVFYGARLDPRNSFRDPLFAVPPLVVSETSTPARLVLAHSAYSFDPLLF